MIRIGAAAFDGVDRHGRIAPDGSEMRGDSVENNQVELIMSERWFGCAGLKALVRRRNADERRHLGVRR
jgi:hypothetical protein